MPESTEDERGGSRRGSAGRATPNPAPQLNISAQLEASRKRVGSAKYYDIASALMGKGHTGDLQELFLAAARVNIMSLHYYCKGCIFRVDLNSPFSWMTVKNRSCEN